MKQPVELDVKRVLMHWDNWLTPGDGFVQKCFLGFTLNSSYTVI